MSNDGKEMRFRGVRKRKWGKYVAEIRSGKRSRISLGSYFTPHAAARAYDAALLCLRGPHSSSFNFPDSQFDSTPLLVATAQNNPSPQVIRTTAIAVGSSFDTVPPRHHNNVEAEQSADKEASIHFGQGVDDQPDTEEAEEDICELNDAKYSFDTVLASHHNNVEAGPSADKKTSTHFGQGVDDQSHTVEAEEDIWELNDAKYLLQSPEEISFEERVQMSLVLPEEKETMQPYDPSEIFPDFGIG